MRYSVMLQITVATTVILLVIAALFAWLQNRPSELKLKPPVTSLEGNAR